MSKGYEERYLMTLLSSVMNQKAASPPLRRLNWDKMFRLSDYHHVAHAVYYGIIGLEGEIPQPIRQQFFDKYLESVFRTERLKAGEKEVKTLLERGKLNCFVLDYSDMVQSYPVEEMCCSGAIEIGIHRKISFPLKKLLEEADFEEQRYIEGQGHSYYRVPGFRVVSYDSNIFFSRRMRKFYRNMFHNLPLKKGCHYVHQLSLEDSYMFHMCRLTDRYARGEISLDQIIDFWIFYKKNAEALSWPYIYERLKALKIADFAEKLENLVIRWFGTGASIEDMEVYEAMESYILTKGVEGRDISSRLLPLIKTVADCYARNRRAEKFKKLLEWTFPDRAYMETIYPLLERLAWLLPFFWIMRLLRYTFRYIWHTIKENILSKLAGLFHSIIGRLSLIKRFSKKIRNEETDEGMTADESSDADNLEYQEENTGKQEQDRRAEAKGGREAAEDSYNNQAQGENQQEEQEERTAEIPN